MNDRTDAADLNERAAFADEPRRRRPRWLLPAIAVLVGVAVAVGGWWYAAQPHSAADQLETARDAQDDYLARLGQLGPDEAAAEREAVAEAYTRVFTAFEATAEQAATAHEQLARLYEHAGDTGRARQWWTQLIDRYGDTPQTRAAYDALIDSYVTEAKTLLASDRAAATTLLNEAADTCQAFIDRYGTDDAEAPAMAMRRCRILDDLIGEPARAVQDALEDFIATYADSDLMGEALWRLGRLHERIAEPRMAADYYERLIDEHPDSPLLKKAEIGRARTVSEFDPERGEDLWRELAAKYDDDPEVEPQARREADRLEARQEAEAERRQAEAARRDAREYREERYGGGGGCGGGGGHVDTGWGKPIPPSEMLRDFIAQRINAEHYRLHLSIDPVAHTLEMSGSVVLVNEGDEKADFLLMLGPLMEPGAFALDGAPVEVVRPPGKNEVIHLRLDQPWPAGARATLTFAYTATVESLNLPDTLPDELIDQVFSRRSAPRGDVLAVLPVERAGPDLSAEARRAKAEGPLAPKVRHALAGGASPRYGRLSATEPRRGGILLPGRQPRAAGGWTDRFCGARLGLGRHDTLAPGADAPGGNMSPLRGSTGEHRRFRGLAPPAKVCRPFGTYGYLPNLSKGNVLSLSKDGERQPVTEYPRDCVRQAAQGQAAQSGRPSRLWLVQEADAGDEPMTPEGLAGLLQNPGLQLQLNDSGYALSGAAWYPVTIFGDLFTAEIAVTLPEELTVLASGAAAGEEVAAGARTTSWRCEEPYFGLYFAYGPYERLSRDVDGLTVSVHFFGEQQDRMAAYLDAAEAILTEHIAHFGPFPFEKLAMAEVKLPPILGGVGPASLTFLHHAAVAGRDEVPVNLLAHELSHQWWGNQVPINLIDERYSQWLSEGFATYSDALYTEWSEGVEPFREHIRRLGDLYLDQSAHVREEAIVQTFMGQSPLYRPVVYEKGALVLHALRYVLGDETFFEVLQEYVRAYAFTPSTVDDFRRLAAERSGRNLDWFFDEWLDRPGCPRIELADATVEPGETEGTSTVTVSIVQPAHLSRMPIDVAVYGGDGRSRRVRTDLDRKAHTVTLDVEFPVERVVLDPDDWVLRRKGPDAWAANEAKP
ncbi:MAG: M1 family aminopeptidase [Planctomycetota bacterium]